MSKLVLLTSTLGFVFATSTAFAAPVPSTSTSVVTGQSSIVQQTKMSKAMMKKKKMMMMKKKDSM